MLSTSYSKFSMFRALPIVLGLTFVACGGEDAPADDDDSADENKRDGGRDSSRPDGGGKPDAKPNDEDASTGDAKLDALKGRYAMRFDTIGEATSAAIVIRSRLSTLLVTELRVEDGKLVGTERVCTQDALQDCQTGCTAASTVVDPRTIAELANHRIEREYTLSGDTLTGERVVAQLGYDDEDPDANAPMSRDDDRLWDIDPGNAGLEGFLTKISVTSLAKISCDAYGTQKYVSTFSGKVGGTDEEPVLGDMELDLLGSAAYGLGSKPTICGSGEAMVKVDEQNARMVRYGDDLSEDAFWKCPDVATFDELMEATPL